MDMFLDEFDIFVLSPNNDRLRNREAAAWSYRVITLQLIPIEVGCPTAGKKNGLYSNNSKDRNKMANDGDMMLEKYLNCIVRPRQEVYNRYLQPK